MIGAILRARSVLGQVNTTASIASKVSSTTITDASINRAQEQPISLYPANVSVNLASSVANTAVLLNFVTSALLALNSTKVGATISVLAIWLRPTADIITYWRDKYVDLATMPIAASVCAAVLNSANDAPKGTIFTDWAAITLFLRMVCKLSSNALLPAPTEPIFAEMEGENASIAKLDAFCAFLTVIVLPALLDITW